MLIISKSQTAITALNQIVFYLIIMCDYAKIH